MLTRHFQTRQVSKQWIPCRSVFRVLEDMFQQNEEVKKGKKEKEREAWEMRKGEKDIEMKDKNFHDKVKKKSVQKSKDAPNPD